MSITRKFRIRTSDWKFLSISFPHASKEILSQNFELFKYADWNVYFLLNEFFVVWYNNHGFEQSSKGGTDRE
ncbi:hypothetical protein A4H02_08190 [Fervidobacterium thailandense]|uniref:Uncharacterized protein n=1 Tax=Fervidobacterium thailandense TaxID=1008305 RepID=A0A1E3G0W9_9BACT|nr:hypothetical protein A4H02_08190 [Fervidobacterium thailandense]